MTHPLDTAALESLCAFNAALIANVRRDQLALPTPCAQWNVLDLLHHIVASTDYFADAAEFGLVAPDREWPDYEFDEIGPAFAHHVARMVRAFRDPTVAERPMRIAAGPSDPSFCLEVAFSERFAHAWDLAVATGQPFDNRFDDVAATLLRSEPWLAVQDEVRLTQPPALGARVDVAADQSATWRLLGYLGRTPR